VNLIYGEVVGIIDRNEPKMARIKIGGAIKEVSIALLTGVRTGDKVLLCDGVAIAKVNELSPPPAKSPGEMKQLGELETRISTSSS
jgi:hydrogenase maturation factor